MEYSKYRYIYPPRPLHTIQPTELSKYDNNTFVAQPKYNGSCCVVFMNESETIVMNRHNGILTTNHTSVDFRCLYSGKGWMVVVGEFLNKNKKGEDGNSFNIKYILFDILVYNGKYLIGKTLEERLEILEKIVPSVMMSVSDNRIKAFNHLCVTKCENIFKAPSYANNFFDLYQDLVSVDLYEGVVLKRKDAKLQFGFSEKNNNEWQIKCRKPTKNYDF